MNGMSKVNTGNAKPDGRGSQMKTPRSAGPGAEFTMRVDAQPRPAL